MLGLITVFVKVTYFHPGKYNLDAALEQLSVGVNALAAGDLNALVRSRKSRVSSSVVVNVDCEAATSHGDVFDTRF